MHQLRCFSYNGLISRGKLCSRPLLQEKNCEKQIALGGVSDLCSASSHDFGCLLRHSQDLLVPINLCINEPSGSGHVLGDDAPVEFTLFGFAGHDGGTRILSRALGKLLHVQSQPSLARCGIRAMALETVMGKDRFDITIEQHPFRMRSPFRSRVAPVSEHEVVASRTALVATTGPAQPRNTFKDLERVASIAST